MSSSGPIASDPDFSPRNNPTCGDFDANRPVVKTIHLPRTQRSLNRPGRAIVRIVTSYGWTAPKIGRIFGVGVPLVQKVIANTAYNVQDDVSRDYEYAPAEYGVQFPPKDQKPASILRAQSPAEDRYFPASFFESMIQSSLGPSQEPGIVSPSLLFDELNQTPSNNALAPLSLSQIAASEEHVWSSSFDVELYVTPIAQLKLSPLSAPNRSREPVPESAPLSPTRRHHPGGETTASTSTIAESVKLKRTRKNLAQENVADAQPRPAKRPRTRRNHHHQQAGPIVVHPPASGHPPLVPIAQPLPNFLASAISPIHAPLLLEQGCDVDALQILARWPSHLREAALLRVLLMRPLPAPVEAVAPRAPGTGLRAAEIVAMDMALRKLASTENTKPLHTLSSYLESVPKPAPRARSKRKHGVSLVGFLANVLGFDLREHWGLLESAGWSLDALCGESGSPNVQEMLADALLRGSVSRLSPQMGMSPLEVVVLCLAVTDDASADASMCT